MKVHYNKREGQCAPGYFESRGTEDTIFIVDSETNTDIAIALGLENAKLIASAINGNETRVVAHNLRSGKSVTIGGPGHILLGVDEQ